MGGQYKECARAANRNRPLRLLASCSRSALHYTEQCYDGSVGYSDAKQIQDVCALWRLNDHKSISLQRGQLVRWLHGWIIGRIQESRDMRGGHSQLIHGQFAAGSAEKQSPLCHRVGSGHRLTARPCAATASLIALDLRQGHFGAPKLWLPAPHGSAVMLFAVDGARHQRKTRWSMGPPLEYLGWTCTMRTHPEQGVRSDRMRHTPGCNRRL